MKHEYDQNVHVHFGQQVLDYMQICWTLAIRHFIIICHLFLDNIIISDKINFCWILSGFLS